MYDLISFIGIHKFNYIYFIDIAGIAWCKKSLRKDFDKEENFTKFHKMAHKLLEAPTEGIVHMIQAHIVDWLMFEK